MADNLAFRARQRERKETIRAAGGDPDQPSGSVGAARTAAARGDPTGGGMSPGFAAKYQQALAEQALTKEGGGIQPTPMADLSRKQRIDMEFKTKYGEDPHAWTPEVFQHYQDIIKQEKITNIIKGVTLAGIAITGGLGLLSYIGKGWGLTTAGKALVSYKTFDQAILAGKLTTFRVASNTKTLGLTGKILATLGISGGAITLAMATLGTYPFAGFIKEEAIQTLSFGYRAAMDAGDLEGADNALNEIEEVLYGASILGDKLPISNIANAIKDFTDGAKVTLAAQRELVKRMRDGTDKWSLIQEEQEASAARITADRIEQQRVANIAIAEIKLEAQKARDKKEEDILLQQIELWEKHRIRILELEKQARIDAAAFWLEYTKERMRMQEDIYGRSRLGFGLFG